MSTGYVPKSKSPALEAMPTLLFLSSIATLLFGIGAIIFVPAIIAIEVFAAGQSATLSQFGSDGDLWVASTVLLGFGGWCLTYRYALLRGFRWFRAFFLSSLVLLFCPLAVSGLWHGVSFIELTKSFIGYSVVFVAVPAWYFYRKQNVVAFFRKLYAAGFDPAA